MKSINEDIKNNTVKQMYLLCGEEAYLKRVCKNKLKEALVAKDDTMNFRYYDGKNSNQREIIDLAETLPFFADRRLIMIEDSGFFKEKSEEIADYLKDPAPDTYFVFVESDVDKRGRMYKVLKEKGRIVELGHQDEKTLIRWLLGILNKENKKITEQTMQLFLEKSGTDMDQIQSELEKLLSYTMGRDVITETDVEEICSTKATNQIFEMIHAVSDKRQKEALRLYDDLLALKEPPMRILFLLARQFNLLLQIKDLARLGFTNGDISKKVGLPTFVLGRYLTQARAFTTEQLRNMIENCVLGEEAVKTGQINDVLSVELLLIQFSQ